MESHYPVQLVFLYMHKQLTLAFSSKQRCFEVQANRAASRTVNSYSCYNYYNKQQLTARWGGCSSADRAGQLVIGSSLVQFPAPGRAELHVQVSLSKILNPTLLIKEYPALALRQGWDWHQQQHPATPWKGISSYGQ